MKSDWARVSHRAFKLGILIKGLDGLLELVGGSALLLTSRPASAAPRRAGSPVGC